MKYVDNFYSWALDWYGKYSAARYIRSMVGANTKFTIVGDVSTGKTAVARCSPKDEFNPKIGIGVAYARLCGEEIPQERKAICIKDLSAGDVFVFSGGNAASTRIHNIFIGINPITNRAVYSDNEGNTRLCSVYSSVYKQN